MRVGNLELVFHRTIRVPDGRSPANLPPSLGPMTTYKVSDYKDKCPDTWEEDAVFVPLHDTEALWISFGKHGSPVAVLLGAGGINALTGEKLGTKLVEGNYMTCPPQPWIDGWKSDDGSVYQFVATPYQKGEGNTVAEQLIGAESKTGAIGIAVFDPKDDAVPNVPFPKEGHTLSMTDNEYGYSPASAIDEQTFKIGGSIMKSAGPNLNQTKMQVNCVSNKPGLRTSSRVSGSSTMSFGEMGVGKGGKITQHIYPDPYGLAVWKDSPTAVVAVYVVNAQAFEEITGIKVPAPRSHENYSGHWFGLQDEKLGDVSGTSKFTGLKSAFIGDTTNIPTDGTSPSPVIVEGPVTTSTKDMPVSGTGSVSPSVTVETGKAKAKTKKQNK